MNTRVLFAVFKRNFVGYFANPTGYVFICVFVLLSSIAAFLPYEFFSANLANLAQLNQWFPLIMLVFIPAITMGIWADERRQGTDELLLTIPAGDFEIVFGKYLSAVAIYTVSLLFSLFCNHTILSYLGNPDSGLFHCTYLGYWFTGIAMLSIGMVASFLTGNLTIAYIVGAIFCVPLVAIHWANAAPISPEFAGFLQRFSISSQFDTFGRGIVNFSNIVYFLAIIAIMLYLCMVLIGKRHWSASQQFVGMFHYTVRTISLILIGLSLTMILERCNLRADLTAEKLSTLSPLTLNLIRGVDSEHPVVIEAYLSPEVPETYIQTRMNIISVLKEFESRSGGKITVRFHEIKPFTEAAMIAAERYNITPREVWYEEQGNRKRTSIFLGVAFRCGLQSQTLPFINRGLSVEYELVHTLCSITDPQKKRVGILKTDAPLFGQFSMQTFSMSSDMLIIEELKKRYTVVEVDPSSPIMDSFDALLAVQPSSLGPAEMDNFIAAIKKGQPTVIFEDPFPLWFPVSGTMEPRRAQNQFAMMGGQSPPKGDISELWDFLGVQFEGSYSTWQDYNPIRKIQSFPKGVIFLDKAKDDHAKKIVSSFSAEDPITKQLQYMIVPFPGSLKASRGAGLKYQPLLWTIRRPSGTISIAQFRNAARSGMLSDPDAFNRTTEGPKELAVHITGEKTISTPVAFPDVPDAENAVPKFEMQKVGINIVLVSDIDMLHNEIFQLQEQGSPPGMGINLDFENVPFIFNAIDSVAGDDRFLAIRTRRPVHRTLQRIDKATNIMREKTLERQEQYKKSVEEQITLEQEKMNDRIVKIREDMKNSTLTQEEIEAQLAAVLISAQKNLQGKTETLNREMEQRIERETVDLNEFVHKVQGEYKFYAVALPPIPPLLIGFCVFISRRMREYEGVPKTRRKK